MNRRGGGIAIIFRSEIQVTEVISGSKLTFEFAEYSITVQNSHLKLLIIYRPDQQNTETFLNEFTRYLELIVLCSEQLIITGDFNFHVNVPEDINSSKFLDVLESMALEQHVNTPSHMYGRTLDLIITREHDTLIQNPPTSDYFLSDHCTVLCELYVPKPSTTRKQISYVQALNNDLQQSVLCNDPLKDLDSLVACYNSTLITLLDKHAPIITKTIPIRLRRVPWFNNCLKEAKQLRRTKEINWPHI